EGWPGRYADVKILSHPGANLAPWYVDRYALQRDRKSITVDGQPLLFFHFHGLSRDEKDEWRSHFPHLERQFEFAWRELYRPYLIALQAESRRLMRKHGVSGIGPSRSVADWPVCLRFAPVRPLWPFVVSRAFDVLRQKWPRQF